jgi:hypothetical protein
MGTNITDSSLHFTFVLGLIRPTRHDMEPVMPAEVSQFGINFRIKPIGLENRRF